MNKAQAANCLTLANLLKKKYAAWDFSECRHCAMGVAKQNCKLFNERESYVNIWNRTNTFGYRAADLFFGDDILSSHKDWKTITQTKFRTALLKIIDQEGWEEA